jgi:hypothetical protein
MEPMKPMEPMAPMAGPDSSWWPRGLSRPSASGAQDGLRYAFFPEQRRLAVEQDGRVRQYDTGAHRIHGVSQQQSGAAGAIGGTPRFSSQLGEVDLGSLKQVD